VTDVAVLMISLLALTLAVAGGDLGGQLVYTRGVGAGMTILLRLKPTTPVADPAVAYLLIGAILGVAVLGSLVPTRTGALRPPRDRARVANRLTNADPTHPLAATHPGTPRRADPCRRRGDETAIRTRRSIHPP
jgi:hypothetical protein